MQIREDRPTLNFLDSYRAHYGVHEDVVIRRLERIADQPNALRLELTCHRPDFRHFELSAKEAPFHASRNNTFIIRFGREKEWQGRARPVYDRIRGEEIAIAIRRSSDPEDAPVADPLPPRYTVYINPPLEMEVPDPESWSLPQSTAADRRFAKTRWGKVLQGVEGDYEQACALAKALCRELWPHDGTPTMPYDSPFGMYRRMITGKNPGFCVQFNMIFVHACRCLGLDARNLHLERPVSYGADAWIFLSGMHCASELFDRGRNRWIFMDIQYPTTIKPAVVKRAAAPQKQNRGDDGLEFGYWISSGCQITTPM